MPQSGLHGAQVAGEQLDGVEADEGGVHLAAAAGQAAFQAWSKSASALYAL